MILCKPLLYRPDSLAHELVVPGLKGNEFQLTQSLHSENIVDFHLAESLIAILNLHPHLKENTEHFDKRAIAVAELKTVQSRSASKRLHFKVFELAPWLWGLLSLFLVTERIFAKYRKQ